VLSRWVVAFPDDEVRICEHSRNDSIVHIEASGEDGSSSFDVQSFNLPDVLALQFVSIETGRTYLTGDYYCE
jgi:hypothetical protein